MEAICESEVVFRLTASGHFMVSELCRLRMDRCVGRLRETGKSRYTWTVSSSYLNLESLHNIRRLIIPLLLSCAFSTARGFTFSVSGVTPFSLRRRPCRYSTPCDAWQRWLLLLLISGLLEIPQGGKFSVSIVTSVGNGRVTCRESCRARQRPQLLLKGDARLWILRLE